MKTTRLILAIVTAACAALLLSACQKPSAKVLQIGQADAGKTLQLQPGQQLVIVLEGNPTTGYTWETQPGLDESVLKQAGEPQFQPDTSAVGSGGKITMTFTAGKPGEADLILLYHRPWEKNVDPLQTYEVKVVVAE